MPLTDADRDAIARARELASVGDVCKHTGDADPAVAYARAFGAAQYLLADLAARLEQHGS